jgi:biotin transporter BioY
MRIDSGAAIVLAYVVTDIGVIIAFLSAVFVIGWLIQRLRERRRGERREEQ